MITMNNNIKGKSLEELDRGKEKYFEIYFCNTYNNK